MNIRRAVKTDIDGINKLLHQVLMVHHNEVLGYAFCVFQQHINNNILTDIKTLYIDDLCVDEEKRGMHVGKQ